MKQILLLFAFCLAIGSCDFNNSKTYLPKEMKEKQFFQFDTIDYYFNNYEEMKVGELFENESRSALDSIKKGLLIGDIPVEINDLSFISYLIEAGYKKKLLDENKWTDIGAFFVEKKAENHVASLCIHVYRDILIFKKEDKVIGIGKICFQCNAHQIIGSKANTSDFGQDGDYEKLEQLLRQ